MPAVRFGFGLAALGRVAGWQPAVGRFCRLPVGETADKLSAPRSRAHARPAGGRLPIELGRALNTYADEGTPGSPTSGFGRPRSLARFSAFVAIVPSGPRLRASFSADSLRR